MKINFKLTKKDYWHYNNFSILHIKDTRKIFIRTPLLLFCVCAIAAFVTKAWLVCGAVGIVLPVFYIMTVYLPMTKGINNMDADKLKEHTLVIDTDRKQVVDSCNGKEKKVNSKNLLVYKQVKNRIFITLQDFGGGIIIPESSEYNLNEIKSLLDKIFAQN